MRVAIEPIAESPHLTSTLRESEAIWINRVLALHSDLYTSAHLCSARNLCASPPATEYDWWIQMSRNAVLIIIYESQGAREHLRCSS